MRLRPLLLLLTALVLPVQAQTVVLSGYVEDAATGERLVGATLFDLDQETGTTTNRYGFFSLARPPGTLRLRVSYVGYRDTTLTFTLQDDAWQILRLHARTVELEEVEVVAPEASAAGVSEIRMDPRQIEELPALLGETDVLKAFQLMPGVQGGTEGTAGIYVRGGSPDQNLILLDGAPVYNVSHLFGFFSVFNTDALQDVTLIKGGFPARYGGRLSSVLDVTMREGNRHAFAGRGSLGLLASRLTLEGPLVNGKSSFIVSGRRTYLDLLARPFYHFSEIDGTVGYFFHDLNAKANYVFSDRRRVFVSIYAGDDRFYSRFREDFESQVEAQRARMGWGNLTGTVRYTQVLSPKLFLAANLVHSRYRFGIDIEEEVRSAQDEERASVTYLSSLRDWSARLDLDYTAHPRHTARLGLSATHHTYRPDVFQQQLTTGTTSSDTTLRTIHRAVEGSAYVEDQIDGSARLTLNVGLHASGFFVEGTSYGSLQPRLSARYRLTEAWQVRASFTTMRQYIHLLTNSGIDLPTDLWVPATAQTPPQNAMQAGLALERSRDGYTFGVEGYYKRMDGVIAYRDGASFIETGTSWEDKITSGEGAAYGLEVLLHKWRGRTTGWIGYTLAWARRRFDAINGGRSFPYRYDRRHDLSLVLTHRLSERRSLSLTWVYRTGIAVTLPVGRYILGGTTNDYYEGRNGFRMRPYHRLDLGYRVQKPKKRGTRELSFGIYNLYSRLNPFYTYLDTEPFMDPATGRPGFRYVYKEVGLFPIIPSINYRFTF